MYKCEICSTPVGPRKSLQKWVIYKEQNPSLTPSPSPRGKAARKGTKQIEKELKVCPTCLIDLQQGIWLGTLRKYYKADNNPIKGTIQR